MIAPSQEFCRRRTRNDCMDVELDNYDNTATTGEMVLALVQLILKRIDVIEDRLNVIYTVHERIRVEQEHRATNRPVIYGARYTQPGQEKDEEDDESSSSFGKETSWCCGLFP